jgi:putative FmdB family regulatory protein
VPTYQYKCSCGNDYEAWHHIKDRDNEVCPDCGFKPERVWVMTSKPVVYEYYSESLDCMITGPEQKKRLMKEKGVVEAA